MHEYIQFTEYNFKSSPLSLPLSTTSNPEGTSVQWCLSRPFSMYIKKNLHPVPVPQPSDAL